MLQMVKKKKRVHSVKTIHKVLKQIADRLSVENIPCRLDNLNLTIYEPATKSRQLKVIFGHDKLQDIISCRAHRKGSGYGYNLELSARYFCHWVYFSRLNNIDNIIKKIKDMIEEAQQYFDSRKEKNDGMGI